MTIKMTDIYLLFDEIGCFAAGNQPSRLAPRVGRTPPIASGVRSGQAGVFAGPPCGSGESGGMPSSVPAVPFHR
jgi:hypothetical protein